MSTATATKRYAKTYYGQVWYNLHGAVLAETGHENKTTAVERMKSVGESLRGVWAFSVIKTMTQEAGHAEVWDNCVRFPDGKVRVLKHNEIPVDPSRPKPLGEWITIAEAKRVTDRIRAAPAQRFPFRSATLECRHEIFPTFAHFEEWLSKNQGGEVWMVDPRNAENPMETGLHAYLTVAPR